MPRPGSDRRRLFWPVVLIGLAGAGLAAYAGDSAVTALGLAMLAAWGVLLVVRVVGRRLMVVVILLDAVGVLWSLVHPLTLGDAWPWAAGSGAVAAAGAAVLAWRWAPTWPEMGSKYDAPQAPADLDTDDNAGLWRQLSEGRDPTEDGNA